VASLKGNQLPEDVAKATKDIDVKLATFGGVVASREAGGFGGGRGRGNALPPGAIKPFNTLNGSFDAIVSTSQVGLDEAPTQAEIDTWKDDCKDYNATVAAWKKMQSQDLAAFNTLLSRNNLNPLHVAASALTGPSCTLTTPAAPGPSRASVKK
jgi:hypothetical protein